jgi:copper chaperone
MGICLWRPYFLHAAVAIHCVSSTTTKDTEMNLPMQIEIDNLKCGGCEKSIIKGLTAMSEISDLVVDREHQIVRFTGKASVRDAVAQKLRSMGYPEKGLLVGMDAGLANAKSFVSCAVGRFS